MKTTCTFDFPLRRAAPGLVTGLLLLSGVAVAGDDDQKFPATGQTTCYDSGGNVIDCAGTGQDGEIRAGARLRYRDQSDGTIHDRNTGLTWEKKSDDEDINDKNNTTFPHDKDNVYTWDEAFALHVATLNNICKNNETVDCSVNGDAGCGGVGGKCGFAGKRDWRVPNVKELLSIINYQNFFVPNVGGAAVSVAFNRRCVPGTTVLTGSCTVTPPDPDPDLVGADYWSSTSLAGNPERAWAVGFDDGSVPDERKSAKFHVRAVRGGLRPHKTK